MNGPSTMTGQTSTNGAPILLRNASPNRANPNSRPTLQAGEDGAAIRLLTYLRLHWMLILFVGSLLGAGLAYATWTLLPPKYESNAMFQVASRPIYIAGSNDPNQGSTEFVTFLKTAKNQFKTQEVYRKALQAENGLLELPTLKKEKDLFKYFDENLIVENLEGSEFLRISLIGENPADVQKIVDAIANAYDQEIIQKLINEKKAFREKLTTAKIALEGIMKTKAGSDTNNGSFTLPIDGGPSGPRTPLLGNKPADPTADPDYIKQRKLPLLITKVVNLETEIPNYDIQIQAKQNSLNETKKALQAMLDTPISPSNYELAKKNEEFLIADTQAKNLRQQYVQLRNTVLNPNSEKIQSLFGQVEQAEIEAQKVLEKVAKTLEIEQRQPLFERLNQEGAQLTQEIRTLQESKKVAEAQLAAAKREMAETPAPIVNAQQTETDKGPAVPPPEFTDLMTHDKIYERLTAQLVSLDFELQSDSRVKKSSGASVPSQVDSKKQIFGTILAGLMGFALIGAGVIAYESNVRKLVSLRELKSSNPTPIVGVLPWMPDGNTARDPIKRADVNEAIDKLRSYVVQTWLTRGATTITVTSALGDEGKSFTSFGLASSLAQAGYKTLLVDFDLRNPALHVFGGVPNDMGVCELLRGEADFRKTIQILPNGLHFLAAGKWSDDARQAAVGGRLEALLTRLKEPFDCVVLHGNALLTVAESIEVARRSEVVLLCALYRDTRVQLIKRASDRINSMEIPYSGIVYLGATPQEALC